MAEFPAPAEGTCARAGRGGRNDADAPVTGCDTTVATK
jgi:hypothetical protein